MGNEQQIEQLGYARILLEALAECSRLFGTDDYKTSVYRLLHCCLDTPNGPQIRTIVDKFMAGEWWDGIQKEYRQWHSEDPFCSKYDCETELALITNNHMSILHDYIAQTLMTHQCTKNFYGGEQ